MGLQNQQCWYKSKAIMPLCYQCYLIPLRILSLCKFMLSHKMTQGQPSTILDLLPSK